MSRIVCFVVFAAINTAPAFAHGLGIDAALVGDTLKIEVFFDDDTPADHATLTLTRQAGGFPPIQGTTDERGRWTLSLNALPQSGVYVLFVDAGDGHAVTKKLTIPERLPKNEAVARLPEADDRANLTGTNRLLGLAAGVCVILVATYLWKRRRRGA